MKPSLRGNFAKKVILSSWLIENQNGWLAEQRTDEHRLEASGCPKGGEGWAAIAIGDRENYRKEQAERLQSIQKHLIQVHHKQRQTGGP